MKSRKLGDWVTGYLQYTENTEPPKSYHVWTAIHCIAAALQRKVYMQWGYEKIYPNMYIVLIGPSGKCRKGTAMTLGKDMISSLNIAMTSECTTREALIGSMKEATSSYTDPDTKKIKFHCSLTAQSEELSVFLGQSDTRFLSNLTNWYDSLDNWEYKTMARGKETIQGVCLNLLGATAPDWLQSILPQEAIGGGFTSRIIFVVEEQKGKTVAKHEPTIEEQRLRKWLKQDLEQIHLLAGEFIFSDEAEEDYIEWYETQDKLTRGGKSVIQDPLFSGYCERRATHVKKIGMAFSASRSPSMVVDTDDFARALQVLIAVEVKMPKVFGGLGMSPYGAITEKLLNFISSRRKTSRSELLIHFYRDVDTETLKKIEDMLSKMKVIKVTIVPEENEAYYEYIG